MLGVTFTMTTGHEYSYSFATGPIALNTLGRMMSGPLKIPYDSDGIWTYLLTCIPKYLSLCYHGGRCNMTLCLWNSSSHDSAVEKNRSTHGGDVNSSKGFDLSAMKADHGLIHKHQPWQPLECGVGLFTNTYSAFAFDGTYSFWCFYPHPHPLKKKLSVMGPIHVRRILR